MPETVVALTKAVKELTAQVHTLDEHLTIQETQAEIARKQAKRTNTLSRVAIGLTVVAIAGLVATFLLFLAVRHSVQVDHATQVSSCQNNNDARAAAGALWLYLIDATNSQNKHEPESQKKFLNDLRRYVVALYAPRDCSHLGIHTTPPTPPPLPQTPSQSTTSPTHHP